MTQPGGGSYNANVVLSADIAQYQQAMASAGQVTDSTTSSIQKLGSAYTSVKSKVSGKLLTFDRESVATLAAGTASAALFQKQLSTLAATSAVTGTSMKQMKNGIESAFVSLPVARGQLTALATQLNQLGVTAPRDIGNMIVTFTKLAAVTGGSANSLAAAMTTFTQSMGDMSAGNVQAMSNSLVNLSKTTGTSATAILNFASAIAPIGRVAGITENQVLGLSTAFAKVGADGPLAANTFNAMLQDITQLSSIGSPAIAKYANQLGLTIDQFNKLPKAQAIAELFQVINSQGQQGISTLNSLGIQGTRAITSLQSVVQSGSLNQLANGGSTTNNALNKGASAAFNNLADNLAITRNEMTQYGTYIGTTFLTPLNTAVQVVNALVRSLGMLKPLLAVPVAAVGLAGSALAPALSLGAPLVTAALLARNPAIRGARTGFGAGRRTGAGSEAEMAAYQASMTARGLRTNTRRDLPTAAEAARMTPEQLTAETLRLNSVQNAAAVTEQQVLMGRMGPLQRTGFQLGAALGESALRVTPQTEQQANFATRARNMAIQTPGAIVRTIANAQVRTYRNAATRGGYEMPATDRALEGIGFAGRGIFSGFGGNSRQVTQATTTRVMGSAEGQALATSLRSGAISVDAFTASIRGAVERVVAQATAENAETSVTKVLAKEVGATASAMARLTLETTKATLKVTGQAIAAAAAPAGRLALGAGKAVGSLVGSIAGSPLGATMLAGFAGYEAYNLYKKQSAIVPNEINSTLNPIQKVNEALGIASTNLAIFANNTDKANQALGASATYKASTFQQASSFGAYDASQAKGVAPTDAFKKISGLKGAAQVTAGAGLLAQMPLSTPSQLQYIAAQMYNSGIPQNQVQAILSAYNAQNPTGPNAITGTGNTNLYQLGATNQGGGKGAAAVGASVISGIQSTNQANANAPGVGTAAANVKAVQDFTKYVAGELNISQTKGSTSVGTQGTIVDQPRTQINNASDLAHQLSTMTHGGYGGYNSTLTHRLNELGLTPNSSADQRQQGIIKLLGYTSQGRAWLKAHGVTDKTTPADFNKIYTNAINNETNNPTGINAELINQGPLGKFAATSTNVQSAGGTGSGNPQVINAATNELANQAVALAGNMGDAGNNLRKLAASLDPTGQGPMAQVMLAAAQLADSWDQAKLPNMTRAQQGTYYANQLQNATVGNAQGTVTTADLQTAQGNWNQWLQGQQQYQDQAYSNELNFVTQMNRSQRDYRQSVSNSNRDFYKQQLYAQQDYNRSVMLSQRDFSIQMERQAQQSAEAIYSPYQRIQSQFTLDAGTLVQNLQNQNNNIAQQYSQLQQITSMGVSQSAIDTLQLADPNNAQQLNELVKSLAANPQLVAQINAVVSTRIAATTQLTQSNFTESFRNTVSDFSRQLGDTATQFQIAQQRASNAQQTALGDMARSYHNMTSDAATDLQNAMTDLTGSFSDSTSRLFNITTNQLAQWAPGAAAIITTQLNTLKAQFPFLFGAQAAPAVAAAGKASATAGTGATQVPVAPAAPRPAPVPVAPPTAVAVAGHGSATAGAHAMGGISTVEHLARISEQNKAEMIIPLDQRGQQYMVGMYKAVAASVAQELRVAGMGSPAYGGAQQTQQTVMQDYSTNFTGAVSVTAQDPNAMAKALQQKAALTRLRKPVASTAGVS